MERKKEKYIVCWGDSLTACGGWTTRLEELSGVPVYNAGTGGENSKTVMARQGADAMVLNNIIIPADKTPVIIAKRENHGGIPTVEGNLITPLLQRGEAHVNPCMLGSIEGKLTWTGSAWNDMSGVWTFTRAQEGEEVVIKRPTVLRTAYDRIRNTPYLMIIFMGQNRGSFDTPEEIVRQHKLMIAHSKSEHVLILGLSSGSAEERKEYEAAMKKEFGRYFLSLREYLSAPIYDGNGEIVSCYGLDDQGLAMGEKEWDGVTYVAKEEIAKGIVPHQILKDIVHFTPETTKVIGNLVYKYCFELGIF